LTLLLANPVTALPAHTAANTNRQDRIVKGNYQLLGMRILGFETSPTGTFIFHQRKQQGRWMILKAEILQ